MRFSVPLAIAFAVAMAAMTLTPVVPVVVLVACLAWALTTPLHALQSLMLSALLTYANPALITIGADASILIRVVLLAAALRVLPTLRVSDLGLLWPVWAFVLVTVPASLVASPAVAVSMMKLLIFLLAVSTVLMACNHLRAEELERLRTWAWTLVLTITALSALTIAVPSVGFNLTGTGLQGLLSHPQSLAIVLSPFAAALITGALLMRDRSTLLESCVAVVVLAVMLMTQARTAAIATVLGVLLAFVTRFVRRRTAAQAGAGRAIAAVAIIGTVIAAAALATGQFGAAVEQFVLKRGEDQSVTEAFEASRGGGAASQWRNFVQQPFTGHGFGVYADGEFPSGVVEVFGIPISAPVEKGFVPTAVLEETGIFGGLAFAILIIQLARRAWRNTDLRQIAMFTACLGVNLGEALLTSPGGIGLVTWILIGLTIASPRRQSRAPARQPLAASSGTAAARA